MISILYIIPTFPNLSETFIQREIKALSNQGVNITIYSLRHTKLPQHDDQNKQQIIYRFQIPFFTKLKSNIQYFIKYPFCCFKSIFVLFSYISRPIYFLKLIRNYFTLYYIALWIKQYGVQLIHAHFFNVAGDLAHLLSQMTGIHYTISVHARDIFVNPIHLKRKCLEAKSIITCSHYAKHYLIQKTGAFNIQTVYHGLPLNEPVWGKIYQYRVSHFDDIYHTRNPFQILAIGRFVRKKGFHLLIESLKVLQKEGFPFQCQIIGGGKENQNLRLMIQKYHLDRLLTLKPVISFEYILEQFKNSHLLVVPSIIDKNGDRDNIPNVILEAQALGVPVLTSTIPSFFEVVHSNKTGFIIDPNCTQKMTEEIKRVLTRQCPLFSIIKEARKNITKQFNIDINTKKIIRMWKEKINEHCY